MATLKREDMVLEAKIDILYFFFDIHIFVICWEHQERKQVITFLEREQSHAVIISKVAACSLRLIS